MEGEEECSVPVLFLEKDQVLIALRQLAAAESPPEAEERGALLARVTACLEKYQEQPNLLDPHLEEMMGVVMLRAAELVVERERDQAEVAATAAASSPGGHQNRAAAAASPRPFPFQVCRNPQLHALFKVVYLFCRVRGAKAIVRLMPHEVSQLEPVLHALQSQDRRDHDTWESRYALLLWLSMLALVPFDIATIDSGGGADSRYSGDGSGYGGSDGYGGNGYAGGGTLVDDLLRLGREYLSDPGPPRDAAATCLSSLLARPDVEARCLRDFLDWAGAVLAERAAAGPDADRDVNDQTFLVTGVMATLARLFKGGHRERLLAFTSGMVPYLAAVAAQGSSQTLLRKMLVKLFQRIGMAYLPPRIVSWRYQRGQRSLLQNLAAVADGGDAGGCGKGSANGAMNGGSRDGGANTMEPEGEADHGENEAMPEELEEVVEQLLCGLRDRDTVVRWSAAKGAGRITGRLPPAAADDVVTSVLDLFADAETDAAWHGGCLALAELARRGLLLPARLPVAVPAVCGALRYDVRRGHHSVGTHVRDAACYVCWAFARAYAPVVLRPHVDALSEGMLAVALFDREINVRRAAAAAFQENVGRQGHENFAHGVEILTAADYYTLGNCRNAFLHVAPAVAKFARYRPALVEHLCERALTHWDPEIRRLAAAALAAVVPLEAERFAIEVLPRLTAWAVSPDLLRRHGACLASAEVTLALAQVPAPLPEATAVAVAGVVPAVEAARLYRGRGGELMRAACCRLIECTALAALPLPLKLQLRLLDSVDEGLRQPSADVQEAAGAALAALLRSYFPISPAGPSARLRARTTEKYVTGLGATDNAAAARGYALAIGALPRRLAAADTATLRGVLGTLAATADPAARVGDEADAETRVNAIVALAAMCEEVGIGGPRRWRKPQQSAPTAVTAETAAKNGVESCAEGGGGTGAKDAAAATAAAAAVEPALPVRLGAAEVRLVFDALLRAAGDYSMDKRGDVGSWCRTAALRALERLALLAARASRGVPLAHRGDAAGRSVSALLEDPATDFARIAEEDGVEVWVEARGDAAGHGRGRVVASRAAGAVLEVAFARSEPGFVRFAPSGIGFFKRSTLMATAADATASPLLVPALAERQAWLARPASGSNGGGSSSGGAGADGSCANADDDDMDDIDGIDDAESGGDGGHAGGNGDAEDDKEVYFTPETCVEVLCVALKQLSEKLDAVRDCAGRVLERLLRSNEPRLPFVPCRAALEAALSLSSSGGGGGVIAATTSGINWAAPAVTYRMVVRAMALPPYHDAVAAGLVVSVGGLTESVVKQSSAALLAWARAARKAGDGRAVAAFAARLLRLFDEHPGDDRIILPLLRTLDLLLSNNVLQPPAAAAVAGLQRLPRPESSTELVATRAAEAGGVGATAAAQGGGDGGGNGGGSDSGGGRSFAEGLLARLRREARGCRDVPKLAALAAALVALLEFPGPVRVGAWAALLLLLAHRFPRVRKQAAEAVYVKLLAAEDLASPATYDDALELLTATEWDGDATEARRRRDELATLLGFEIGGGNGGGDSGGNGGGGGPAKKRDEMESYSSLVRVAGY